MKLLLATQHLQRIGGVETYLSDIIPALRQAGHDVAVLAATGVGGGAAGGKDTIFRSAPDFPVFVASDMGGAAALAAVRAWRPDVVYAHGITDPKLEAAAMAVAPSVFFVHVYHGTCISGAKRFARPVLRPCHRTFGPACLLHYFPHRCGGLNPFTMVDLYFKQRARLRTLRACDAVVTHSFHMFKECAKHGIDERRLHRFVYFAPEQQQDSARAAGALNVIDAASVHGWAPEQPLKLLFAGRLDINKGVNLLVEAAVLLAGQLRRKIAVTIIGDGPDRHAIETQIGRIVGGTAGPITFEMPGWLPREKVRERMMTTDVVVFPSVWPEPFGLVGPEAGHLGVPVAAFDVGGVKSWMVDGVNGVLAPGDPPTAGGLAVAIAACVRDEPKYRRLCKGAVEMAERFSRGNHLEELMKVFHHVAGK